MAKIKLIIDNEITLITETSGTMHRGVYQDGEPIRKVIKCNVQPSTRELTKAEYGYFIDAEYRVFCYVDTDIKEGMTVDYKNTEYTIEKLIDWNSYYILYLKAVGL